MNNQTGKLHAIFEMNTTRERCSSQFPIGTDGTPGDYRPRVKKKMVARFDFVPVVEVSAANFSEVWPFMVRAINETSFVAVDTVGTQLTSCVRHAWPRTVS